MIYAKHNPGPIGRYFELQRDHLIDFNRAPRGSKKPLKSLLAQSARFALYTTIVSALTAGAMLLAHSAGYLDKSQKIEQPIKNLDDTIPTNPQESQDEYHR
jgi:hypothetical protein